MRVLFFGCPKYSLEFCVLLATSVIVKPEVVELEGPSKAVMSLEVTVWMLVLPLKNSTVLSMLPADHQNPTYLTGLARVIVIGEELLTVVMKFEPGRLAGESAGFEPA